MHPALWLARVRDRAGGVPVLAWSPADQRRLLAAVLRDPAALVIALPPLSGDPARDREELLLAQPRPGSGERGPAAARAALRPAAPRGARRRRGAEPRHRRLAGLRGGAGGGAGPAAARPGAALGRPIPEPATRARRRAELDAALAACRFRDAGWFPALAATLAGAYDRIAAGPGDDPAPAAARGRRPAAETAAEAAPEPNRSPPADAPADPGHPHRHRHAAALRLARAARPPRRPAAPARCRTAPAGSGRRTSCSSPACATSARACRPSPTTTAGSASTTSW